MYRSGARIRCDIRLSRFCFRHLEGAVMLTKSDLMRALRDLPDEACDITIAPMGSRRNRISFTIPYGANMLLTPDIHIATGQTKARMGVRCFIELPRDAQPKRAKDQFTG